MLAVARVIGRDGAPAAAHRLHDSRSTPNLFAGPQAALPHDHLRPGRRPTARSPSTGPGARALVLIVIVMLLNLVARADRALQPSPLRPEGTTHHHGQAHRRLRPERLLRRRSGPSRTSRSPSSRGRSRRSSARPAAASRPSCARSTGCTRSSPAPASRARSCSTTRTSTAPASTRSTCAARSAWSSSGRTRSRRCRSTTTSSPGCGCSGRAAKSELDDVVEKSLRGANLWDEVKDRLDQARRRPVRWPAAAAVHRPRHRRRAAGAADGRAVLGARPDLDAGHRGPDQQAQGRRTRSSSSPTTCSRPPGSRDRTGVLQHRRRPASPAGSSRWTTPRRSSATRPRRRTEDYITGRFG